MKFGASSTTTSMPETSVASRIYGSHTTEATNRLPITLPMFGTYEREGTSRLSMALIGRHCLGFPQVH
jgi:hypothetical protein